MHILWLLPVVAGLATLTTTTLARRFPGPMAGILAAAPITPTVSLIVLGSEGLLAGAVPVVAWTMVIVVIVALAADVRGRLILPGALVMGALLHPLLAAAVLPVALVVAWFVPRRARPRGVRALAAWQRFSIGAGVVGAVMMLQSVWPAAAGIIAMLPWLFVASAVAAWLDAGADAGLGILTHGLSGAVGVLAFLAALAVTTGWPLALSLGLAWVAFAAAAAIWGAAQAARGRPNVSTVWS